MMKKKTDKKKLAFDRETVRTLSDAQLKYVAGGSYPSDSEGCGSDSSDPSGGCSGGGSGGGIGYYP